MAMLVFVQWKWNEKTKSFLVIFHFLDDYTRPNLRLKRVKINIVDGAKVIFPVFVEKVGGTESSIMTWAPSHIELGLLSELLSYANIINGLKEKEKRELKRKLVGLYAVYDEDGFGYDIDESISRSIAYFTDIIYKPKNILGPAKYLVRDRYYLPELCPKYIEYLRKILKPYMTKE